MNTEKLTTDKLFEILPNFLNRDGDIYHFGLIKGNKRIIVWYKMNDSEGGKFLGNTNRSGDTLKEALKNMLDWLIEFGYYDPYYDLKSKNILLDMLNNNLE